MTDYTSWHVGMEVVYDGSGDQKRLTRLTPGAVYKVRSLYVVGPGWADEGDVGITLHGLVHPVDWDGVEPGYLAARFRPVQKRKTSIEIFERLLTDPHVRIEEDA